jgi:transcriptional regulator with XRE-family HTH domain
MPRQSDLAREAEMQQSRISMFETPGAANVTLETLARLAATFRTGLVVKFVPFSEMLAWENRFSQDQFNVLRLDEDQAFLNPTGGASGMTDATGLREVRTIAAGHEPTASRQSSAIFAAGAKDTTALLGPSGTGNLIGHQLVGAIPRIAPKPEGLGIMGGVNAPDSANGALSTREVANV